MITKAPCSQWVKELVRQMVSGQHVLLHGAVHDMAVYAGLEPAGGLTPPKRDAQQNFPVPIVELVLQDLGYQAVIRVNPTGIAVIKHAGGATGSDDVWADIDYLAKQTPNRNDGVIDYGVVLPRLLGLVEQTTVPVAVVFDHQDIALHEGHSGARADQADTIRLKELSARAASFSREGFACSQHAVVWVAEELKGVPETLYRHNPRAAVVAAQPPTRLERRQLLGFLDAGDDAGLNGHLDKVADLTEGLSGWQIACLPQQMQVAQVGFDEPRKVARLAIFGEKDDPWAMRPADEFLASLDRLGERVLGQQNAVKLVREQLILGRSGLSMDRSLRGSGLPRVVLFFAGPTGVGKTLLAKQIAEVVTGNADDLRVFDMGTYTQEHSVERLTGASPGYIGYDQGGQLTRAVIEKPFSVLLFDEVEKAHERIWDTFLSILDEGRLTDASGDTAFFGDTVIIFTSNEGHEDLDAAAADKRSYEDVCAHYEKAIKKYFTDDLQRPELYGRKMEVVGFDVLRDEHLQQLLDIELGVATAQVKERSGRRLEVAAVVRERILSEMMTPQVRAYGARQMRNLVEQHVLRRAAEQLVRGDGAEGEPLAVS